MFYLRKKRTIAYTMIVFILFVGMCLGYLVADSVSVCAKTKGSTSSIRSISGLSHGRQDAGVQEKSRIVRQASQRSSRRNEMNPALVGTSEFCSGGLPGNIHFHSMTIVSEDFVGSFREEGIVRYLHLIDGEKEDPNFI